MKPLKTHKRVITVILEEDELNNEGIPHMFYCFHCRIPVLQYTGSVMHVVPGMHPYEPSTALKCKGTAFNNGGNREECNHYYAFLSTVKIKRYVY